MNRKLQEDVSLLLRNFTDDSRKALTFGQVNHYINELEDVKERIRKTYPENHDWVDNMDEVDEVGKGWVSGIADKKEMKEKTDIVRVQLDKIVLKLRLDRNAILNPQKETPSNSASLTPTFNIIQQASQNSQQNQSQTMNNEINNLVREFHQELEKRKPDKGTLTTLMEKMLSYWPVAQPVVQEILKLINRI